MAFPNLSEIVTTTLRSRTGELADNMSRNNALLARLNKRGKIKTFSGGRTIVQELNYANNQTFQWYSGYQTLNIAPSQTFSAAEYPIRQSAVAVSISGLEELQNSGELLCHLTGETLIMRQSRTKPCMQLHRARGTEGVETR